LRLIGNLRARLFDNGIQSAPQLLEPEIASDGQHTVKHGNLRQAPSNAIGRCHELAPAAFAALDFHTGMAH
jgi:hypothetical protein